MTEDDFKNRTRQISLRIINLVNSLPAGTTATVIGKQLIRSGTSIGANYRTACRGKSRADVLNKLAIVEEEADESMYWIDLLIASGIVPERKLAPLAQEINEIVCMVVASIKTLRGRHGDGRSNPKSKIQIPK